MRGRSWPLGAAALGLCAAALAAPDLGPAFRPVALATRKISASVDDIDADGWIEPLLTWNDGNGRLLPMVPAQIGLKALFEHHRAHRDARLADFNGDGLLDVVANTYGCIEGTEPPALLFFNDGARGFVEQPGFRALGIRGRGETIVVADFDNDQDVDVFIPFYTFAEPACPNSPRNYLLRNDGTGQFTDVSEAAGITIPDWPAGLRPEGAQAVDLNRDGHLDLYVASHLFINNGDLTFTDRREEYGLPLAFDEGLKFVDWNEDGWLDLVLHHPTTGPRLFEFDGSRFQERVLATDGSGRPFFSGGAPAHQPLDLMESFGVNAQDLDGDGREEIFTMGDMRCDNAVLMGGRHGFERAPRERVAPLVGCTAGWGAPAPADVNRDGRLDVVYARYGGLTYYANLSTTPPRTLRIDVLGAGGRRNQYGRTVQVTARAAPGRVFTRVVDGGSGFMSQTPYTIQLATPYRGPHRVTAFFGPSPGGRAQSVTFHMRPGEHAEVQADGTVRVRPQSPGAPVPPPPRRAEPGVFRRGDLSFHLGGAAAPDPPHSLPFGIAGDVPLAGDWNGDGITTIGIYRPSESAFYLSDDNTSGLPAYAFPFELPGAPACKVPIVGDWHGSGIDTIGFYVPEESTFYLVTAHGSAAGAAVVRFGAPGDVPVIGDWDGNGTSNIGVYRPAERRFLLRNCNSEGEADLDFVYGMPGDQPVAGDADGDGIDTVGVYRPAESTFYLRSRNAAGSPDLVWTFGASGDVPLLGAWWP